MLLGHKIGLASAYYRPSEDEMLNEYLKAVDNLTINEENRLKRKVEVLTVEKSKVDFALASIEEMKREDRADLVIVCHSYNPHFLRLSVSSKYPLGHE